MTPNTVWVQDKGLWVVSYVGPQVSGAISIGNSVLQIQEWEKTEERLGKWKSGSNSSSRNIDK